MDNQIYFVKAVDKKTSDNMGVYICIGKKNLKKTIEVAASYRYLGDWIIGVNKAVTCFDGYLTNGEYIGQVFAYDIREKGFDKAIKGTRLFYIFND